MSPTATPLLDILALVHRAAQIGIVFFGVHRLLLLADWRRFRSRDPAPAPRCTRFPRVTVQLPIWNERFVAARLIDAAAALDWPPDRLEIQVLDDSTDDTRGIADARADIWRARGVDVTVLHRPTRAGYKAGALAAGLTRVGGEFVAIFDADFIPPRDFLLSTMGAFDDAQVGMVQARWSFVNPGHSWLTRAQAIVLGAHFRIEHEVRYRRGHFFNFNGTAGVWRRRAIEDAGGWSAETVTEDLDLSYRAQLAGWRFVYMDDVAVQSELPVTLGALRTQQRRWAKGSIQTARRILPRLLRAAIPATVKVEAALHLLSDLGWLFGAVLIATVYPAILRHAAGDWRATLGVDLPLILGSTGTYLLYFLVAGSIEHGRTGWRAALLLPFLSIGMAPYVALGILEGMTTRGGVFDRTPKFGVRGRESLPRLASRYCRRGFAAPVFNGVLLLLALLPPVLAIRSGAWFTALPLALFPSALCVYLVQDLVDLNRTGSDPES